MMIPPAGCVFLANTRLGHHLTNGIANASGLLGADKYGQDIAMHQQLIPSPPSSFALPRSGLRALDLVPRVPVTSLKVIKQIGSGAFGKVGGFLSQTACFRVPSVSHHVCGIKQSKARSKWPWT
jgi:hypothetical protein